MQPSPIQLKEMTYLGVKVWQHSLDEWDEQKTLLFDFDGVNIREYVEKIILDDERNPTTYAIQLRVAIENKDGKIAPYDLDVAVHGIFVVSDGVEKEERNDMVTVNGLAMLYSAIRDLVMTLSSRSSNGKFILPTVNFLDKKTNTEPLKIKKTAKKKTIRRTAAKKN